ncbi:MAG: hypothetical protein V3T70_02190, partial [Phycisphaerae bacterium]
MPSYTIQLVVRLSLGLVACTTPERDEHAAATTSAPATQGSAEHSLQFALVPPLDDDATNDDPYERRLAARASALIESAQRDPNDGTRDRRILEAVHFLLSRRCEPALSRILLDIAEESDGPTIASAATSAGTLLAELSESAGEQPSEDGLDAELLAAVADALVAIGAAGTMPAEADPESRSRLVNASIDIAPFL